MSADLPRPAQLPVDAVTDWDHLVMRMKRGAIVQAPGGWVGHVYPGDPLPTNQTIVADYREEAPGER